MAPGKGDRARRKGSAKPGTSERAGRAVAANAELGRGVAVGEDDPWTAFFETFWALESDADDGRSGVPVSGKATRTPGAKVRR